MRRRFSIENGLLKDRDGNVLGEITSLTIDDSKATVDLVPVKDDEASTLGLKGSSFFSEGSRNGEKEEGRSGTGSGTEQPFDPVAEVWKHYVAVMKPRHTGLDAQTRAVIREALKVATVAECKGAIDGCATSDFHMGKNEHRRRYNSPSQVLGGKRGRRTVRENIDFFLDLGQKSGLQPGVPSALNERVRRAKRAVLDAAEFPGDVHVVEQGRKARVWLESQGWTVDVSQDPVRFTPPGDPA